MPVSGSPRVGFAPSAYRLLLSASTLRLDESSCFHSAIDFHSLLKLLLQFRSAFALSIWECRRRSLADDVKKKFLNFANGIHDRPTILQEPNEINFDGIHRSNFCITQLFLDPRTIPRPNYPFPWPALEARPPSPYRPNPFPVAIVENQRHNQRKPRSPRPVALARPVALFFRKPNRESARMNTYQVHVVARRCAAVRDHACARFLRPWNAVTAVRLNRWVSLDRGPVDCYPAAIGIVSSDFVWDAARPVDHRGICSSIIPAAIATANGRSILLAFRVLSSTGATYDDDEDGRGSFLSTSRIRATSKELQRIQCTLVTWKLEQAFDGPVSRSFDCHYHFWGQERTLFLRFDRIICGERPPATTFFSQFWQCVGQIRNTLTYLAPWMSSLRLEVQKRSRIIGKLSAYGQFVPKELESE